MAEHKPVSEAPSPPWEFLILNGRIATMDPARGIIEGGALGINHGNIVWLGPLGELPAAPREVAEQVINVNGRLVTPGLIDCHTHLVFAGDRADEFERRLQGESYESIQATGGGIKATMRATREATEDDLLQQAVARYNHFRAEGVTTIEIKSGYGLELSSEARMLRAARRLGERRPLSTVTTFLGAHALPPEYGNGDDYIDHLIQDMLPRLHEQGLVDAVDAYCEPFAFSSPQISRLFRAADKLGLPVKLHADQLSDGGGAELAAAHNALSADHLEFTTEAGVRAMAEAGTVAVLLPGAYQYLGGGQAPPIAALRGESVPMAVATDCNPGTSPVTSLLTAMTLACTRFGLSPEEALQGVTVNAARALGLASVCGRLAEGMMADVALWNVASAAELSYWCGGRPCNGLFQSGQPIFLPPNAS